MARRLAAMIVLAASLAAASTAAEPERAPSLELESGGKLPPLEVTIDKAKVDLEKHRLEVVVSRAPASIKLKVWGESGSVLADEEHDVKGKPARQPIVVTWNPASDEKVAKIHVYAYDANGYYKGIQIVPWSLTIPHEEVNFETNSAKIRDSQEPKLDASYELIAKALKEHEDLGPITLFIAGHTDTVGSEQHNLELSRRRARSIAGWFRKRGLKIPIAYEGFGETSLAVKTADEVAEERNRRVDYVLSVDTPKMKKTGKAPAWKRL